MTASTVTTSAPRTSRQTVVSAVLGLLVGSLAVNALPHLVQGLSGNVFQTPFGAESSPTVNLAWGAANAVLAIGIAFLARRRARSTSFLVGAAAGAVGTAASLFMVLS